MAKFYEQVESLVGSLASYWSADNYGKLDQTLSDGCKDIIRRVKLSNPEDIWLFTTNHAVSNSGLDISTSYILDVSRGNKECKQIRAQDRWKTTETSSLFYATAEYPVFYTLSSKIFIKPDPGTSSSKTISSFGTYDNGNKTQITTSAAHGFSKGDEIQIVQADLIANDSSWHGGWYVYDVPATPNAAGEPTSFIVEKNYAATVTTGYTCNLPTGAANIVSYPTVDSDHASASIAGFPEQYYNLMVQYGAMVVAMRAMADIHTLTPELTMNASPVAPAIKTLSDSVPVFSEPAPYVMPSGVIDANVDLSSLSNLPTFPSISVPVIPSLTFPIENITIAALDIGMELPVPPESPNFDLGAADLSHPRTIAPTYVKPVFSAPILPEIQDIVLPVPPAVPDLVSYADGQSSQAGSNLPTYTAPVMNIPDYTDLNTSISDEDVEIATMKLQRMQNKISQFQADLQNQLQEYNVEQGIYQKRVDEALQNSRSALEADNMENQAILSKYQSELNVYNTDVQTAVQKWERENIQLTYTKWVNEYANKLQEYQQDIANSLNEFNKEMSIYNVEVQKSMQDATNKLGSENNEYQSKLGKYSSDLQAYQAKTTHTVTEWTTRIAQVAMTEFTQKRQDAITEWNGIQQFNLSNYQNEVNHRNQEFQSALAKYQQDLNKRLQIYQAETGYDIQKLSQEVQAETARYQADLNQNDTKFKSDIANFQTKSGEVRAENTENINRYQAEVASINQNNAQLINEFNAKLAKNAQEYQWYSEKFAALKAMYESGFLIQQEKQQQGDR